MGMVDNDRADQRLAEIGGHDPDNPILHAGWLSKRAISGTVLRTWKKRYVVIRKDRIEYRAQLARARLVACPPPESWGLPARAGADRVVPAKHHVPKKPTAIRGKELPAFSFTLFQQGWRNKSRRQKPVHGNPDVITPMLALEPR